MLRQREIQSLARLALAYLAYKPPTDTGRFRKRYALALFVETHREEKPLALPIENPWDAERLSRIAKHAALWLEVDEEEALRQGLKM